MAERGEDYAKEAYQDALQTTLPANIRDVVAQQSQAVLAAHNRIKALRNAETGKSAGTY
ncbi:MAG: PA2169 family four-helix-bundle protein [Pyrinomonadaceae bacterium]